MRHALTLADRYQLQERLNPSQSELSRQTWLAEDLVDRKKVVVKLAPFGSGLNWADFKLFEREATILRVLDHARIPKYLDFLELDTPDYRGSVLVQEYIEARSFQTQVESGQSFTCEMVKEIAIQTLEILSYLHTLNPPVIHRDIKPSNLLLNDRSGHSIGNVYLVDFGAVQTIASTEYDTFTVVGTYGYMPFEQFGGQCVAASDLYSLGATLIYLLTGQHPANLPQINGQLEFAAFVDLDWEFHQWLKRTIAPAVSQRFRTTQEALTKLKAIDLNNDSSLMTGTKNSTITMHRAPGQLKLKIIGYKSNETISSMFGFIMLMSAITGYFYLMSKFMLLWCLVIVALVGLAHILHIQYKGRAYKDFVATIIVDRQKLKFKFIVFKFISRELFEIKNIKNIVKIERILDPNLNKTILVLWDGIRQHSLTLNESEAVWVGEHLSEWLQVPFEQRTINYLKPEKKS